jgi:hypothetical protein
MLWVGSDFRFFVVVNTLHMPYMIPLLFCT